MIFHANTNQKKKAIITMLILDKVDLMQNTLLKIKTFYNNGRFK